MLINEGGYGCIYRPSINCDGSPNTTGMTKIVNVKEGSREIELSNLIKKIPHYANYFSPIESYCTIQSSKIKPCRVLHKASNFMIMTKPYLQNVPTKIDDSVFVSLLPHLTKLIKAKIVHFDLKKNNIVFTPKPFIIDFGISLNMKKVLQNLTSYFYSYYPYQYEWPIDVHLLCFLVNHTWTEESLTKVCTEVYRHSPVLKNPQESICHYSFLNTCSKKEAIHQLLKGWKTWDMYALTVMLFHVQKVPALVVNFHPDYTQRLSPRAAAASLSISAAAPANR